MTSPGADTTQQTAELFSLNPFTGALALLAFVMAFYGLVIRERKTQDLLRPLHTTAFTFIFVLLLSSLKELSTAIGWGRVSSVLEVLSLVGLVIGIGFVGAGLFDINNRIFHLRTDKIFRNSWVARSWKNRSWLNKDTKTYEHDSPDFPAALRESIAASKILSGDDIDRVLARSNTHSVSVSVHSPSCAVAVEALAELAICFLGKGAFVQYASCAYHPIEFVTALKRLSKDDWKQYAKRVVVVDAYTPHFGFLDTIHSERTKEIEGEKVTVVPSRDSFAGLHTAAAKAFNEIKQKEPDKDARTPTLVIYDGLFALADAESVTQHRVFIRHLFPSERQWGGMMTVLAETDPSPDALALANSYADIRVDLDPSSQNASGA